MSMDTNRRGFLGRMLTAAGALSLPFAGLRVAEAATTPSPAQDADAWLNEVQGEHRCLFDFNQHMNAVGLLHINNFIGAYQGTRVGTVATLYGIGPGSSILMGFDDAIWDKYQIGAYAGLMDSQGRPYTRNVFNSPTEDDGHLLSQAMNVPKLAPFGGAIVASSIPNLQSRGTKFLMCANALGAWTYELEARGKGAQAEIMTELQGHLLPGVTVVPAMVAAIEKAQAAGIRYNKQ